MLTIIKTKLPAKIILLLIGSAYLAAAPNAIRVEEYNVPPPIAPAADSIENNDINIILNTSSVVLNPGTYLNPDPINSIY